jgi:hypothetical protein
MGMNRIATITVAGRAVPVQCCRTGSGWNAKPVPIGEWPITPEALEAAANAHHTKHGCKPGHPGDAEWAATMCFPDRSAFYFEIASAEAEKKRREDHRDWIEGELSGYPMEG